MSSSKSIQRLPVEVDPFRLVDQGRIYQGKIPQSDYPRLNELLYQHDKGLDNKALIDVKLEFTKTDTGLAVILGKISTTFEMPCQRCLNAETVPFETDLKVVLVASDEQAERLQQGYDTWLVEDHRLFLQDFIEDEILLALPYIVSHENCQSSLEFSQKLELDSRSKGDEQNGDEQNKEVLEKNNPFSVLKDLKLN